MDGVSHAPDPARSSRLDTMERTTAGWHGVGNLSGGSAFAVWITVKSFNDADGVAALLIRTAWSSHPAAIVLMDSDFSTFVRARSAPYNPHKER